MVPVGPPPWPGTSVVGGSEGVPVAPATAPPGVAVGLGVGSATLTTAWAVVVTGRPL